MSERAVLRDDLKRRFRSGRLEVVLASYTQVASPDDLSFFRRKIEFEVSRCLVECTDEADVHLRRRTSAEELHDKGLYGSALDQATMATTPHRNTAPKQLTRARGIVDLFSRYE